MGQLVFAYGHGISSNNEQPGRRTPCGIDRTLIQTVDVNWSWWGSIGGADVPTPSVDAYGHRDQHTCTHWERVCLLMPTNACCSLGWRRSSYGWQYGAYRGGEEGPAQWAPLSVCCRKLLDIFHLPSSPQLVHAAVGGKPCTDTLSKKAAMLPLLLCYHMNGCHIALCFKATFGNSLWVTGFRWQ